MREHKNQDQFKAALRQPAIGNSSPLDEPLRSPSPRVQACGANIITDKACPKA